MGGPPGLSVLSHAKGIPARWIDSAHRRRVALSRSSVEAVKGGIDHWVRRNDGGIKDGHSQERNGWRPHEVQVGSEGDYVQVIESTDWEIFFLSELFDAMYMTNVDCV